MKPPIDDESLIAVIEGRASSETLKAVELAIQQEPSIRLRIEQLSGAIDWPLGSAPAPSPRSSPSLHAAILRLEQDLEQVLAIDQSEPHRSNVSNTDDQANATQPLKIVREIGRGGMGVVYEGFDESLGRRVAIKQLHSHFLKDPKARERLKREAQAIASLSHPNVLAIYGTQQIGDYPCLIQQFVDGESLQATIARDGPIDFERCAALSLQIAQGLAAAHAAGIVHRDLKPDNVLIEHATGIARLCDFGLAKRVGDLNMTIDGVVAGTPAYMAPEQTEGKSVDHRSDLFSLGTLMYTMAAGRAPFEGDDPYAVMNAIRSRPHLPLDSLSVSIPAWYARLVDRLLEKDPARRPKNIDEVVDAIRNPNFQRPESRFWRSGYRLAITGVAIGVVSAIGGFWSSYRDSDPLSPRPIPSLASGVAVPSPAIRTRSDGKSFERLEDAIASSVDGETIVIASDLETGRIHIIGKRIQFEAAPETRPTLRFRDNSKDPSNGLLRSDSDLSLKGLRIECQSAADMPWFEDGKFIAGIYTGQGKRLRVDNCEIHRQGGGICLGAGGDLEIRQTWIEGGDVGIGWFALDSSCRVDQSLIQSKIGIGVIYPGANIKPTRSAEFTIERSSLLTDGVLDLLLSRIPIQPVTVNFFQCVLDSKHAATLWMTPMMASEFNSIDALNDAFHQSVSWQDSQCVFEEGMDYLVSRRIRTPNRKNSAGIFSWVAWNESSRQGSLSDRAYVLPSIERTIDTNVPQGVDAWKSMFEPTVEAVPGLSGTIHRFTPELPSPWPVGERKL
jgi:serine/threonine protein kinase